MRYLIPAVLLVLGVCYADHVAMRVAAMTRDDVAREGQRLADLRPGAAAAWAEAIAARDAAACVPTTAPATRPAVTAAAGR